MTIRSFFASTEENDERLKNIMKFALASLFMGVMVPALSLWLFKTSNQYNLARVGTYWDWWIFWGGATMLFSGWQWYLTKEQKAKLYESMGWVGGLIHDPKRGLLTSFLMDVPGFGWVKSGPAVLFASIIFFSWIGYGNAVVNQFFTALPDTVEQSQLTVVGNAILRVEPGGGSEIFNISVIVGLVMFFFLWLQQREGFGNVAYWLATGFAGMLFGTLSHFIYHVARYGTEETKLIAVVFFGASNSFLILMTGSIIPSWVYHDTNNLYHFINSEVPTLSNDTLFLWTLAVQVVLLMLAIILFLRGRFAARGVSS